MDSGKSRPVRLGLALGGGAARGIAHVGVLQVLWEHGIVVDAIAGTSAGAMVGAMIASGVTPDELADIARASNWWFLAKDISLRGGLLGSGGIERWMRRYIEDKTFRDLRIPLAIITSDIATGETVVFTEGDVAWAARVSASVPGIYAPVEYEGHLLVDGGITQNVPVETVRQMEVDVVLAVNLNGTFLHHIRPERPIEAMQQAISILQRAHIGKQLENADLVVTPDVKDLGLTDFREAEKFIQLGRKAMEEHLPKLQTILSRAAYTKKGQEPMVDQARSEENPLIGVVLGSDSDLPVIAPGLELLRALEVPFEVQILSAHRTPEDAAQYAKSAVDRGIRVIVAAAGMAAHLPGVLASHTTLPVIGIPIASGRLGGVDALYSMVQMPPGIPVATVGINATTNGILLAVEILALTIPIFKDKLRVYRQDQREGVLNKNALLQELGYQGYVDRNS